MMDPGPCSIPAQAIEKATAEIKAQYNGKEGQRITLDREVLAQLISSAKEAVHGIVEDWS